MPLLDNVPLCTEISILLCFTSKVEIAGFPVQLLHTLAKLVSHDVVKQACPEM